MPTSTLVPQHDLSLFDGCGEMGQLCREFPWELSPIGAPVTWPASLRIVVRTVLESQFPMCVLCGSDLVQIYNDAFRTVLGSKHPQALGKASANSWREIWTDVAPLLASAQSGEASVLRSGARFVIERDVGAPEETFFALVPSPVRDEDGRVVAVLGVAMETTSKVLPDPEQHANRSKRDFLAAMSHELRTPLNAIGGYAQLLELGVRGPVTLEQKADLRRIQRSKAHLDGLVMGILDFAKLGAGHIELRTVAIDVDTMISSVLEMVLPQLEEKGFTLAPVSGTAGLTVVGDVDKTRQILLNLLGNALKFTPTGGTIRLEANELQGMVRLGVCDTGIGIAAEQLEQVFEPFVQAKSELHVAGIGVGLGLAISRQLARAMGGELTVSSTLGKGSTFTLSLPKGG